MQENNTVTLKFLVSRTWEISEDIVILLTYIPTTYICKYARPAFAIIAE